MQPNDVYQRSNRTFAQVRDAPMKKQRRRLHTAVGGFAATILVGWLTYKNWDNLSSEDAGFWVVVAILSSVLGLTYLYRFISQANNPKDYLTNFDLIEESKKKILRKQKRELVLSASSTIAALLYGGYVTFTDTASQAEIGGSILLIILTFWFWIQYTTTKRRMRDGSYGEEDHEFKQLVIGIIRDKLAHQKDD